MSKQKSSKKSQVNPELYKVLSFGLSKFHENFKKGKTIYLEDSVLWYCLDMGIDWYLKLNINERINFKNSYYFN
jgi:hypothetical protein